MININYGHNKELMDACKDLRDYSIYVAKIRKYMSGDFDISEENDDESNENDIANQTEHGKIKEKSKKTKYKMTIEEAVDRAIDECIAEGVMVDILLKFRAEVKKMSIFEYNEQLHEETLKKEGREKEREEIIQNILSIGYAPEEVADLVGVSLNEVLKVQETLILLKQFSSEEKEKSIFEYNAQLHDETLKKEGRFIELCELEEDGLLTLAQVADRMGMTPEEFMKKKREEQVLV